MTSSNKCSSSRDFHTPLLLQVTTMPTRRHTVSIHAFTLCNTFNCSGSIYLVVDLQPVLLSYLSFFSLLILLLVPLQELHNSDFPFVAPGGGVQSTGRSDGSSLQGYPGADGRFPRSDSSTASPVPTNLPGQTSQPMYNLPQAGYYYLGNNAMMHHGAFPYGPPTMYPTTAMATPNNPSSGVPHTVANHQYQNKGYGSSYAPSYDTSGQGGPANVTDYVNKNTYTTGSGLGGQNSNSGKGSASSTGNSQSTDLASSMYGSKGHLSKMNVSLSDTNTNNCTLQLSTQLFEAVVTDGSS
jgi:hypothetical protein